VDVLEAMRHTPACRFSTTPASARLDLVAVMGA
jgi:hypothetical protein